MFGREKRPPRVKTHPPRKPVPTAPPRPLKDNQFRGPDGRVYGMVPEDVDRPDICAGHKVKLGRDGKCSACVLYGGPWSKARPPRREVILLALDQADAREWIAARDAVRVVGLSDRLEATLADGSRVRALTSGTGRGLVADLVTATAEYVHVKPERRREVEAALYPVVSARPGGVWDVPPAPPAPEPRDPQPITERYG